MCESEDMSIWDGITGKKGFRCAAGLLIRIAASESAQIQKEASTCIQVPTDSDDSLRLGLTVTAWLLVGPASARIELLSESSPSAIQRSEVHTGSTPVASTYTLHSALCSTS